MKDKNILTNRIDDYILSRAFIFIDYDDAMRVLPTIIKSQFVFRVRDKDGLWLLQW